ncbi:MAG: DUF4054 domain-containing protein [Oxalobacter formigenes]|nr:DUF4054 domain-containing protein [Oxalobacter formigenes]
MIVEFSPAEFREAYPRFADETVTDGEISYYWEVACTLIDNTNNSRFPYDPQKGVNTRKTILYLLMCHLLTMAQWGGDQPGPVSSATEGSVSVGFQQVMMGNQAWFSQTPCGRTLFMMLRPYALGGRIFTAPQYHPYG